MPTTPEFRKAYRALNRNQRQAVDAIEGPVMVVAGPGTGKTQVLTLRIANILLKTDTPPEAVLALTFTEKAAFVMRSRLAALIGPTAYRVRIATFHSFANEIIREHPRVFERLIGGANITEPDQLELIETLMEQLDVHALRPVGRPEAYVKAVLGAIGDCKGRAITVEKLEQAIEPTDDHAPRQRELAALWRAYDAALTRTNRYDYADMLMELVRALEKSAALRASLQERYLYILVDEHQDTNRAQNRIVQLIAKGVTRPNVFVVGDVRQAIFKFQGASPKNFTTFAAQYDKPLYITLDENYRSSSAILAAAQGISPAQGVLTARAAYRPLPVETYAFSSVAAQEWGIAHLVAQHLKRGTPPGRIAVLYRTNAEAGPLLEQLHRRHIPCAVRSDDEVLDDIEIRKLLTVIRAAVRMPDPVPLAPALLVDLLGVEPLDAQHAIAAAGSHGRNLWHVVRATPALHEVYRTLATIARVSANASASYALEEAVRQTGFIAAVTKHNDGDRVLAKLHALFDLVRAQAESNKHLTLEQFVGTLDRLRTHRSDLHVELWGADNAVQLMTAHRAKGLEFDVVLIAHAVHGHWDGARHGVRIPLPEPLCAETDDDDARQLFYVALTRARKQVLITWSQANADGRELLPSAYVEAIPEQLRKAPSMARLESAYLRERNARFDAPMNRPPLQDRRWLRDLFQERGLTVTAFNNYLQCPWRYYFLNLIRIPEAPSPKGEYGTAAHAAMRAFFQYYAARKRTTADDLLEPFTHAMRRAPLPEHVIARLCADGRTALHG